MPKGEYLGEFEQIILLALMRLADDAYGMKVRREIEERTSRSVTIGAVYATLDRLQNKGLVESSLGEPTAERGGRAKRTFVVTAEGVVALKQSQAVLERMAEGVSFA